MSTVADTGERECPPGLADDRRTCYHRGVTRGSADGPSDGTTSNQDCDARGIESDRLRRDDGSARRPYRARAGIEAGPSVPPNSPERQQATRRNPQIRTSGGNLMRVPAQCGSKITKCLRASDLPRLRRWKPQMTQSWTPVEFDTMTDLAGASAPLIRKGSGTRHLQVCRRANWTVDRIRGNLVA